MCFRVGVPTPLPSKAKNDYALEHATPTPKKKEKKRREARMQGRNLTHWPGWTKRD